MVMRNCATDVVHIIFYRNEVVAMSAKELKAFLQSKGVNPAGLLEKRELVEKALSLL